MPSTFKLIEDPVDLDERTEVASKCVADLHLPMPAVVDRLDDAVNLAYGGWPDRLYLVGKDGRIAYAGGQGPREFRPDELASAIEAELARIRETEKGAATERGAGTERGTATERGAGTERGRGK